MNDDEREAAIFSWAPADIPAAIIVIGIFVACLALESCSYG